MDTFSFDTINLGHGSGGLMTRELLDQIIFKTFSNPYIDQKHDGATVKLEGKIAISTDSFVVSPIFFKGGNIGELAVHGTVNDVAMCGAIPKYLSLAFIIEEGLKIEEFVKIVNSVKEAATKSGVQIVTGDTKVVERGKGDQIFINTTGFGEVNPNGNIAVTNIMVGDKIIVNGNIAQHGMAIMSERKGLEFESAIVSDSTNLNYLTNELLNSFGKKIRFFRDATRGGLSGVLSEIADDIQQGISIFEKALPIDKQVSAACEILGLDPMYVANEGVFIAIVDSDRAKEVVSHLSTHHFCEQAAIIGNVVAAHPRQVVIRSGIGGRRVVNMLVGQQLPRIC